MDGQNFDNRQNQDGQNFGFEQNNIYNEANYYYQDNTDQSNPYQSNPYQSTNTSNQPI